MFFSLTLIFGCGSVQIRMLQKKEFMLFAMQEMHAHLSFLEEENELQVLGDLLEVWAKWRDGYKLGDVEDKGEAQHRHHVAENCLLQVRGSLLG